MPLPLGIQLGKYKILALLGAGGMGEVYRARDPKLNREVALKVLPSAFAEDPERLRRFQQEAQVLAALGHPDVVQVFDAGECEGQPYLVMELLAGETLRQRLDRGRLPWRKAVELAAAVAEGLAAAHAKGITHRDLKPENLFLTEHGRVKILDFGLAKLKSPTIGTATTVDTAPPGTLDGALLGTVGYMAPEQVRGQPADPRSDVFALGCVLYEMVTGTPAFRRDTTVDTLSAILKDPVPEASLSGSGATPELDRILAHCLEKAPEDRFHSVKDLAFALHALPGSGSAPAPAAAGGHGPRLKWILAVAGMLLLTLALALALASPWKRPGLPYDPQCAAILPFENRSGDPSLEFLGQQVVDAVRQDLQAFDAVHVAPDAGLQHAAPPRRVAEAARARFLVLGDVSRQGDDLVVQARFLDPWSGKVFYTLGPWKGPRQDPGRVLEEARQHVAGAVVWSLNDPYSCGLGLTRPPRLDAYREHLRARATYLSDNAAAADAETRAVALDPEFFMGRILLAFAWDALGNLREYEKTMAALKADFGRCTAVEHCYFRYTEGMDEGRYLDALRAADDLVALVQAPGVAQYTRVNALLHLNRPRSALRAMEAVSLTPIGTGPGSPTDYVLLAQKCAAYHQLGAYLEEVREAREGAGRFPELLVFKEHEMDGLAALGRLQELEGPLREAQSINPRKGTASLGRILTAVAAELRAHGHPEAARSFAQRFLAEYERVAPDAPKASPPDWLPQLLVLADRLEEALALARTLAAEQRESLTTQGRVAVLLARLGRPAEALAAAAQWKSTVADDRHGGAAYYQACIAAELGRREEAVALLQQALRQGLALDQAVHRDFSLENLRGYPPYEELVKPRD